MSRVYLPGQQPAGERHPGDDADAGRAGGRQHLIQRLQPEHVEDDLHGRHPGREIAVSASSQVSTLTP